MTCETSGSYALGTNFISDTFILQGPGSCFGSAVFYLDGLYVTGVLYPTYRVGKREGRRRGGTGERGIGMIGETKTGCRVCYLQIQYLALQGQGVQT